MNWKIIRDTIWRINETIVLTAMEAAVTVSTTILLNTLYSDPFSCHDNIQLV